MSSDTYPISLFLYNLWYTLLLCLFLILDSYLSSRDPSSTSKTLNLSSRWPPSTSASKKFFFLNKSLNYAYNVCQISTPRQVKFCTWIWKTKECKEILFQNRIILSLKCLYFWQYITISEALLCKIRLLTYGHLAVPSGIGRFLSWHHILISPFFVWRLLVSKIWCL